MAKSILSACCICGAIFTPEKPRVKACSRKCGLVIQKQNREKSFSDRFWKKISIGGDVECWNWTYALNQKGYGILSREGSVRSAHRVAYELANSEAIPKGFEVRHKCDNRKCCNPNHLELGTHTENMRDMSSRGRGRIQILTIDDAIKVREMYFNNMMTQAEIGKIYGVHKSTISSVVRGENWTCLPAPSKIDIDMARSKPRPQIDFSKKANTVLTNEIVLMIREEFRLGQKQSILVEKYGVSPMTISRVVRNKSWKNASDFC